MTFLNQNILVIGDSILDHKVFCKAVGLSLETPTLKTRLNKEEYSFGGAANVVNNLLLLGAKVTFVTPLATDSHRHHYLGWNQTNLTVKPLQFDGTNVVKSRYWISKGDGLYKYLQVNQGTKFNDPQLVISTLTELLYTDRYDKAILVDYRGGLFEQKEEVKLILDILYGHHIKTYAASQMSDRKGQYDIFEGAGLICLNREEAAALVAGFEPTDEKLNELSAQLGARVCVTLGADGSILSSPSGAVRAAAHQVETIDTCGAGDSFLAALVASDEDLAFSNKWAAASTLQIGTNAPSLEEVLSWR
jgi:D-beta-D-heptose 7-phosphate kinase/D-beta-D-heptose 1-phosphate adenosyltransferase